MARGDITAGEVFQDREMLERLGYGIFDLSWGQHGGAGFENVRDFSYLVAEDNDPKIYRHKVFEILGRYFDNELAKAMWNKFIDHKWVMSEQAGHEINLETAAHDWFDKYGHAFLKDWTFRRKQIPERIRSHHEPGKGWVEIMAGLLLPKLDDLLEAGFSVTDIVLAAFRAKIGGVKIRHLQRRARKAQAPEHHELEDDGTPEDRTWKDNLVYFVLKKVRPEERDRYYIRLVASLTGHPIQTPEEAEKRWREILEHKWYMSERAGHDVGIRQAALDYYRRLNLLQEQERGQEE